MNLSRSKQSIITRIARNAEGVDFVLRILVVESEAGIDLRVLSATPLAQAQTAGVPSDKKAVRLDRPAVKNAALLPVRSFFSRVISPFSDDFSFLTSQPTRAPSFC